MHKKQFKKKERLWINFFSLQLFGFHSSKSHTHENISNFKATIEMFIFLDSNHPIPNPTKTYKNPKVPKKPLNQKHQHHGIPNSQQPTLNNTRNTQHPRHPYEIENITYILHPFHNSLLIFYYAYVTNNKVSKYTNQSLSNLMKHPK